MIDLVARKQRSHILVSSEHEHGGGAWQVAVATNVDFTGPSGVRPDQGRMVKALLVERVGHRHDGRPRQQADLLLILFYSSC